MPWPPFWVVLLVSNSPSGSNAMSSALMNIEVASAYVLPLPQTKWRTVGDAGATADGLLYLDWLSGLRATPDELLDAILTYFSVPANRAELIRLTRER